MSIPADEQGGPATVTLRDIATAHRRRLNDYLEAHPELERARARLHMLLGALVSHCSSLNIRHDGRAVCWPSLAGIATAYGYPTRSIRRMLRELEDTGVVTVLCGSAVGERDRGNHTQHDGGFTAQNGKRIVTSPRAYQFVFQIPCDEIPRTNSVSVRPIGSPAPVRVVADATPVGRVPPLPKAKRVEIESEIGSAGCASFVSWVTQQWANRPPTPPRPYDFWNARLAEWRERTAAVVATRDADAAVALSVQTAKDLREGVARTAPDRAVIAADLRTRLRAFSAAEGTHG